MGMRTNVCGKGTLPSVWDSASSLGFGSLAALRASQFGGHLGSEREGCLHEAILMARRTLCQLLITSAMATEAGSAFELQGGAGRQSTFGAVRQCRQLLLQGLHLSGGGCAQLAELLEVVKFGLLLLDAGQEGGRLATGLSIVTGRRTLAQMALERSRGEGHGGWRWSSGRGTGRVGDSQVCELTVEAQLEVSGRSVQRRGTQNTVGNLPWSEEGAT